MRYADSPTSYLLVRFTRFSSRNGHINHNLKVSTFYKYAQQFMPVQVMTSFIIVFLTCMFLHISSHITSQSLSTLSVIEDFLSKRPMPSGITSSEPRSQNWVRNLNYYSESSNLSSLSCLCLHLSPSLPSPFTKTLNYSKLICCSFTNFYLFTFSTWTMLCASLLLLC